MYTHPCISKLTYFSLSPHIQCDNGKLRLCVCHGPSNKKITKIFILGQISSNKCLTVLVVFLFL